MILKFTPLLPVLLVVAACSSPPKAPVVDDARKRPVNAGVAVDLQMCRSELASAEIVLTETLNSQQRAAAAVRAAAISPVTPVVAASQPNHVFVINFALGSADFHLTTEQQDRLLTQARNSQFIVIRGRTDASADSLSETRLAQRRSEAAYGFLLKAGKLPTNGIRLSWQGAGDRTVAGEQAADRQANRRVEIELYQLKPDVELLSALAS
jgi:outer membrane protein OmpA-like peptidoglycan-associated protein